MELPIRYRETGTEAWHEGTTVNISVSGVLFRAAQPLKPQTAIEIALILPVAIAGEASAEIGCRGVMVRNTPVKGSGQLSALAASIVRYRFVHDRQNSGHDGAS